MRFRPPKRASPPPGEPDCEDAVITVGHLCKRKLDIARPWETVQAAAQRMSDRQVDALVVADNADGAETWGILTGMDIALRVVGRGKGPYDTRVRDIVTRGATSVSESMGVEEAVTLMGAQGVRYVLVRDAAGAVVGLFALEQMLAHLAATTGGLERLLAPESAARAAEATNGG